MGDHSVDIIVLQAQKGNAVLSIGYFSSTIVVGQESLYSGYLCRCITCTIPPCDECAISRTAPHSKCNLCLWKARGRECQPEALCHGCLKYVKDHPDYLAKAKKLFADRQRMRRNRQTEEPVTFTSQDLSENEFEERTETLDSFAPLFTPTKQGGGDAGASTSCGIELVLAL